MRELILKPVTAALFSLSLAACATTGIPGKASLERNLSDHIATLASDEFEGRFPGTEGGRKAIDYQVAALKSYGFEPGYLGSWEQPVTLIQAAVQNPNLTINGPRGAAAIEDGLHALNYPTKSKIKDLPLLIADHATLTEVGDLSGKAVLLNNPQPGASALNSIYSADAEAVLIAFKGEDRLARVQAASARPSWGLQGDGSSGPALIYIDESAFGLLEQALGKSLAALQAGASETGGLIDTGQFLTATAEQISEPVETANVIGRLAGKKPGSGAVMLLAHWDHMGAQCGSEGDEDRICNGAVDNASGVAAMLEVAKIMSKSEPIDRDIYIMGNTAEELGLLGARAFAGNPPVPLDYFVAAFSLDTLALAEADAPITVIGWGMTPLDEGIEEVVKKLGRELDVQDDEQQFTRRHDGWALMQKGVPSVLTSSAFADRDALNAFLGARYHKADDEFDEQFEIGGLVSDVAYYVELLRYFGNSESYNPPEPEAATDVAEGQ